MVTEGGYEQSAADRPEALADLADRMERGARERRDAHDHAPDAGHDEHAGAVRRFEYRGHTVTIATRYEIHIDGRPWEQEVHVMEDGTVHYHGLPQYSVPSAVDLLKGVIDAAYAAPDVVLDAARGVE